MDYTLTENQETLKEALHAKTLLVSFTKLNGERRDMQCTLNHNRIPVSETTKTTSRSVSTHSLPVFDVNQNAWRSFRWDSIIEVKEL